MKMWIKKVFGFGLASFFGDFSHEMTISLIPLLVTQFVGAALAPIYLGLIASIGDACASIVRLFSGLMSDRLSRKKPLIMLGYGITALFSMLVGFTNSIGQLFLCRVLAFTGSGLREPPRDALIATVIEPEHYGRAFGLRNAMDTLGALGGPLFAFFCAGIFSLKELFALSFIPGICTVLAILFFTHDAEKNTTPPKISKKTLSLLHDFMQLPYAFKLFTGTLFIFDLCNFNKLLLLARTQEMLGLDLATGVQSMVLLYALFNIVRACSELIIGFISDRFNKIILLAFIGCGLFAYVAFLLMPAHASFGYSASVFSLAGISAAAFTTLKKACAAEMLPAEIRGTGYGVLQACEGFATLISSALVGFLWSYYSATISFSYVIFLSLLSLILLLRLARFNISFPKTPILW